MSDTPDPNPSAKPPAKPAAKAKRKRAAPKKNQLSASAPSATPMSPQAPYGIIAEAFRRFQEA
ncbi:MAG: hypothetical protein ACPGVJ_12155, partial [Mangrovicoccus sp.]